jgi:malate dehydrogenase (oxaloacetate-decarboxylating)(NADP+)
MDTQRDLSLAYSPRRRGAGSGDRKDPEVCLRVHIQGNLVAVISNGTAILALATAARLASKPVMEGQGCVLQEICRIDVFDIEVNSHDPDEIIKVVAAISPHFRRHQPRRYQST